MIPIRQVGTDRGTCFGPIDSPSRAGRHYRTRQQATATNSRVIFTSYGLRKNLRWHGCRRVEMSALLLLLLLPTTMIIGRRRRTRQWEESTHDGLILRMIVWRRATVVPSMDRSGHEGLLVGQVLFHVPHVGETVSMMMGLCWRMAVMMANKGVRT